MEYKCPDCGYEIRTEGLAPFYECPKCKDIYEKVKRFNEERKVINSQNEAIKIGDTEKSKFSIRDKKNKKLLKIITVVSLVLISLFLISKINYVNSINNENNELAYRKLIFFVRDTLVIKLIPACSLMCETYSTAWKQSIENTYDKSFEDNLDYVYYEFESKGVFVKSDELKDQVFIALKKINEFEDYYPEAHQKLIEMFGLYSSFHAFAKIPSGSYSSYSSRTSEFLDKIIQISNELDIILPNKPDN